MVYIFRYQTSTVQNECKSNAKLGLNLSREEPGGDYKRRRTKAKTEQLISDEIDEWAAELREERTRRQRRRQRRRQERRRKRIIKNAQKTQPLEQYSAAAVGPISVRDKRCRCRLYLAAVRWRISVTYKTRFGRYIRRSRKI